MEREDTTPAVELLTGIAEFAERAVALAGVARIELALLSFVLEPRAYGTEGFVDAVKRFVLAHDRAHLRVLVNQPAVAMRRAHRLVELGRLLSSRIEFRELPEARKPAVLEEQLIADEKACLYRASSEHLESKYWPHAPLEARARLRAFNALWDESVPAREFANLRL